MRAIPLVRPGRALLVLLFSSVLASACERIPAGEFMWVRLTAPVSSYNAKVGDLVTAVVTQDVMCGDETAIPVGASVLGTVKAVRKVGLGFRHETAALKISFDEVAVTHDMALPIVASIATIDNAREQVSKGVVQGIRSTNTLQGTITSRLKYLPALNPYPDIGLLLFKATFPIFPEPEIYFPPGTEMQIKLDQPLLNPPSTVVESETQSIDALNPAELRALVASIPERSTTTNMVTADVVNFAFIGSKQQFESAFTHAGWQTADPVNRRSILLNIYAYLQNGSYAQAPMRPFLLDGQVPDMNRQKSFNTYAQRDHMRVWEFAGTESTGPILVGTATHDRSAGFSLKHHQFLHHIDPNIDDERGKIIRDLRAAGCVKAVYLVPRVDLQTVNVNGSGDALKTDGGMAVVQLQDCHAVVPELEADVASPPFKPGNAVFRYLRRDVLTLRSDMWRANIIYGTFDVLRMGFNAWKHHEAVVVASSNAKQPPSSAGNSTEAKPSAVSVAKATDAKHFPVGVAKVTEVAPTTAAP
jgi:LssY C-terminus